MLALGGNAVLAYRLYFDLEGEFSGHLIARGYGTSITLVPRKGDSESTSSLTTLPGELSRLMCFTYSWKR